MTGEQDAEFVIGLRLDPDRPVPDLYTGWTPSDDGPNTVTSRNGRIQWTTTSSVPVQDVSVCSVPAVLAAIERPDAGDERAVALALDLLDDLVAATGLPLGAQQKGVLDEWAMHLFEGATLAEALAGLPKDDVIEAVMAVLGRVLCRSDITSRA